jgi:tetratricopeptide (TPR) repeat protein
MKAKRKARRFSSLPTGQATVATLYNLANAHLNQGRLEQAHALYRQVLTAQPVFAEAANNLGNVLRQWDRREEAGHAYARALVAKPDFPEALSNLGIVRRHQGRPGDAEVLFRRAIALRPTYPAAHNNLGNLLKTRRRLPEAIYHYTQAILLKRNFPEAASNLGAVLRLQGKLDEAAICFNFASALNPAYPDAHNNYGNLLQARGLPAEAVAAYRRATVLKPAFAETYNNRGTLLQMAGNIDEALGCYRRAISLRPDYAEAHNNLAMALLAGGNFAAGWQEYEWRWDIAEMTGARPRFAQPRWQGEPAAGRSLLIHAEQGFGDTLQFCRFAPLVAARGIRVTVQVQRPLVRLLSQLPGVDRVMARGETAPPFDLHCPMLSLPLAMNTTLDTIPAAAAYLHAPEEAAAVWRRRLADLCGDAPRIGLAWAGNPRRHSPDLALVDRRRSMAPARLAPLFEVAGVSFVSLQKDGPRPPDGFPLIDVMSEMADFADTAALIANLDLVVTVDTAIAHLAAALGKPVWIMDRFDSCWRWLRGRQDSPWYPTARLFRQPAPDDWETVVSRVRDELALRFAASAIPPAVRAA